MINDNMIQEKAKIYSEKQIPVHIVKHNGEWLNGFIDEVNADFLMVREFKKELMPVFFKEINYIETYTKERGEG